MPRPIWKGYITFGLVNIPVVLYPGEKKFDIQFKLIDNRDKSRIRYVRVNENTGEEVPWSNVVKGYEYNDNDYLRNQRDSTAIAPYSTRAKSGAPVATPLNWDELSTKIKPDTFTIENLHIRLMKLKSDPWNDFFKLHQTLNMK
ncbi:MAG: Ku protein [uncultured bacterium]|nr:MAG: Ku protein [uncultured bacterium]